LRSAAGASPGPRFPSRGRETRARLRNRQAITPMLRPADMDGRSGFYTGHGRRKAGDLMTPFITMRKVETGQTVELYGMVHLADASFYETVAAECAKSGPHRCSRGCAPGSTSLSPMLAVEKYLLLSTGQATRVLHRSLVAGRPHSSRHRMRGTATSISPRGRKAIAVVHAALPGALRAHRRRDHRADETFVLFTADLLTHLTFTNRAYELRLFATSPRESWRETKDTGGTRRPAARRPRRNATTSSSSASTRRFEDPSVKTIALPWGAAHLADLRRKLETRGFEVVASRWAALAGRSPPRSTLRPRTRPRRSTFPFVVH